MELKKPHTQKMENASLHSVKYLTNQLKELKCGMGKYKLLKKLHLRWCFVATYTVEHNPLLFYSLVFHNVDQV